MLRTLGTASDEPHKQRQIRQPSDNSGQQETLASAPQNKSVIVVGTLQNQPFRETNLRYHSSVREKNISPLPGTKGGSNSIAAPSIGRPLSARTTRPAICGSGA